MLIVSISGNIFLYPPQGHPMLYNHLIHRMGDRRNILDLLKERPVIGDGSYVRTLEKRGYVRCGSYTPEAVVEYPDAGHL